MYRPEKCFKGYEGNKCDLCGQCIRDAQRREKESFVKASKYDRMVDLIKIPMKYGMIPTIRKLRTIIDETIKSDSLRTDEKKCRDCGKILNKWVNDDDMQYEWYCVNIQCSSYDQLQETDISVYEEAIREHDPDDHRLPENNPTPTTSVDKHKDRI